MSPRPRKDKADSWLPKRVYRGRNHYYFVPKNGPKVQLAPLTAKPPVVIQAYNDYMSEQGHGDTVNAMIDAYLSSPQFLEKAAATQKAYFSQARVIRRVFGKANVDEVEPRHVRQFMDKRGVNAKASANNEKAFLSTVYAWGFERGMCKGNPAKGVRKFRIQHRDRYVEDWEYNALYKHANARLQAAMDIAYLCGARKKDVLKLMRHDIKEDGLYIKQSKTGVKQIKVWTPRLREAIDKAVNTPSRHPTMFVFHKTDGSPWGEDALEGQWYYAWRKAQEEHPELERFTFHDLKAKGVSDYDGANKREFSGHKTESQVATYDRKARRSPTLDPDKGRR
nr:integrase [Saccharospirillaceae bacterium]